MALLGSVIRGNLPSASGVFGRGFNFESGPEGIIRRSIVSGNRDVALYVKGSPLTIEDLHVTAMREEEATGAYGRAINYQFGATGALRRVLIEDGVETGVAAVAESGQVSFEDLVIRRIRSHECTSPPCAGAFFGVGVLADTFSPVSVTRFAIEDCDVCGVQLANDGAIDLSSGAIRRNDIGACIQVDGYDIGRLSEDVSYEDNGSNLDSTTLPVPPVPEVAD